MFSSPDLGFLDDQIKANTPGFKAISGAVPLFGGFGYGEVSRNIKFGGFGFGGALIVSGTFPHPTQAGVRIRQDVTYSMGGGGLYTEYEAIHLAERFEGAAGLGIGFGGTDIRIDQFGSTVRWDDLFKGLNPNEISNRETFAVEVSRAFFMLNPEFGVKFFITDFMALEGRVGYMLLINVGDWQYQDVKALDAPDADLSAPTFGFRLIFGG